MEVGQVIGTVPAWMELGPLTEVGGLSVREVLGDFSQLPECDRPPKYVTDSIGGANAHHGYDRSDDRAAVVQTHPGKHISELHGIHTGAVAVLFNGASLAQHDLHRITVPIIGMNRTHVGFKGYNGPQPDYLVVVDWAWFDSPIWRASVLKHPRIINGSTHKENVGYRVTRHPRMSPFSFDLARDGYVGPCPCTTGHLALQAAAYLGFTDIYCLGWDLTGGHFNGTGASPHLAEARRFHKAQAPLLKARGINVYVCGSPESKVDFYEHRPFDEVARCD